MYIDAHKTKTHIFKTDVSLLQHLQLQYQGARLNGQVFLLFFSFVFSFCFFLLFVGDERLCGIERQSDRDRERVREGERAREK